MKTHLITVPTFTFNQIGEDNLETPIQVSYYNGTIDLTQNDNSICLLPEMLNDLFKEIKRHLPEAQKMLEK